MSQEGEPSKTSKDNCKRTRSKANTCNQNNNINQSQTIRIIKPLATTRQTECNKQNKNKCKKGKSNNDDYKEQQTQNNNNNNNNNNKNERQKQKRKTTSTVTTQKGINNKTIEPT